MFWKVNKHIQIICTFSVTLYYYQSFIIRLMCQTQTFILRHTSVVTIARNMFRPVRSSSGESGASCELV
jgi:hypothetical protein